MGNVICDGTTFTCSHCSSPLKICVSSSAGYGDTQLLANTINNHFPPPGGICQITSSPCCPDTQVVDPGQTPIQICANPALGSGCIFSCSTGGTLQVQAPGQTPAQHVTTTPPEQKKCSLIRADILSLAIAVRDNKNYIKYLQTKTGRIGGPNDSDKSYDCSGFVSRMFKRAGASLINYGHGEFPATWGFEMLIDPINGPFKQTTTPQPGDLVFWPGHHIGIYEGKGKKSALDAAKIAADQAADTADTDDADAVAHSADKAAYAANHGYALFISALSNDNGKNTSIRSMPIKWYPHEHYKYLTFTDCIP
ncbi:MAG: NlpC/P60 family protein [Rhabdochlamydiaceae bacterium]